MKCEEVERLEKQIKSLEVLVKLLRAKLKQAREVKKKGAKRDGI
jgi:archaellum component FlaC